MSLFRKKPLIIEAVQLRAGELPYGVRSREDGRLFVETVSGPVEVKEGDWICRQFIFGQAGDDIWPVKPVIFDATYEPYD